MEMPTATSLTSVFPFSAAARLLLSILRLSGAPFCGATRGGFDRFAEVAPSDGVAADRDAAEPPLATLPGGRSAHFGHAMPREPPNGLDFADKQYNSRYFASISR